MKQNIFAVLKGFSIFVLASIISLALLLSDGSIDIALIFWPSLVLAGFVTSFYAKSHKLILAITLAIPSAIVFGLENLAWTIWSTESDIFAAEDFVLVVLMTLPYTLGLCATGGLLNLAIHAIRDNDLLTKLIPSFLSN